MSTLDTTQTAARNAANQSKESATASAHRLAHNVDDALGSVTSAVRDAAHEASDTVGTLSRRARDESVSAAKQTRRRARRKAKRVNRRATKKFNSIVSDANDALEQASGAINRATPSARATRSRRGRVVYTAAAVSALIAVAVILRQRLGQAHPASVRLAAPTPGLTPDVATQGATQAPIIERSN